MYIFFISIPTYFLQYLKLYRRISCCVCRQVQLHVKLKTKRTTKIYLNDVKKFGPSTTTQHSNNSYFKVKNLQISTFMSKQVQQHIKYDL